VYNDAGYAGKTRSGMCEIHGTDEATAEYRKFVAKELARCLECRASPCCCGPSKADLKCKPPSVLPLNCNKCGGLLEKVYAVGGALLGVRSCVACYPGYEAHTTFDRKEFLRCDTCKESPCDCLRRLTNRCPGCRTNPCDCNEPVWSSRFRSLSTGDAGWAHGNVKRPDAQAAHEALVAQGTYDLGPIQRITEPPYEFPSSAVALRVHAEVQAERFPKPSTPKRTEGVIDEVPTCGTCGAIAMQWEILNGKTACVHCWKRHADAMATPPPIVVQIDVEKVSGRAYYATMAEIRKAVDAANGPALYADAEHVTRANALADRCQTLEDENRDLLAEIGRLRREADRRGRR
jgi:hypothetical protein